MERTVFNIVNAIQQFHSDLADYYFEQKNNTHDTKLIALLDYLGRSERYLEHYVDSHRLELTKESPGKKISIPASVDSKSILKLDDRNLPTVLDKYEKAMAFAIRADGILINFCKHIMESTDDPVLALAFKNLCRVSKVERRNLFSYNNIFAG